MVIQDQTSVRYFHTTNHMDSKSDVKAKNYIEDLPVEVKSEKEGLKSRKRRKPSVPESHVNHESEQINNEHTTEISNDDLEELRSIYQKCKAVIKKIETKYGHLLNLENEVTISSKKLKSTERGYIHECKCGVNKKIIFDEDGHQIVKETSLKGQMCLQKSIHGDFEVQKPMPDQNVTVQHEENILNLPDDLPSLSNILKDPEIGATYRNNVIYKMKMKRQELANEIRFERPSLREKLKANPEEIFEFEGANLFSLPGYPDWK